MTVGPMPPRSDSELYRPHPSLKEPKISLLRPPERSTQLFTDFPKLEKLAVHGVSPDTKHLLPAGEPPSSLMEINWHYGDVHRDRKAGIAEIPLSWLTPRAGRMVNVRARRIGEASDCFARAEMAVKQAEPMNCSTWHMELLAAAGSDLCTGILIIKDSKDDGESDGWQLKVTLDVDPSYDVDMLRLFRWLIITRFS